MSLGRYGADDSGAKKVSLEVTVDRWVSEALGKIRSKKSVSNFVNGILGTVIKQYDPGPSSPFVYDLVQVMEKHRKLAEASEDTKILASIAQLHSLVEAYIDLAEAEPNGRNTPASEHEVARESVLRNNASGSGIGGYHGLAMPPIPVRPKKDYYYYAVPIIHCEKPTVYLRNAKMWKCFICGKIIHDT